MLSASFSQSSAILSQDDLSVALGLLPLVSPTTSPTVSKRAVPPGDQSLSALIERLGVKSTSRTRDDG
jgi:hypothetical protein